METTYSHANTTYASSFDRHNYGKNDEIKLGNNSDRITMHYPIRSKNIQAELSIPENARIILPDEGTLFSLDNITECDGQNFTFKTRYIDISRVRKMDIARREYTPEKACLEWEMGRIGDSKEIFERYQTLLNQVVGKEKIDSLKDIGVILDYVGANINEWEYGPGKTSRQVIDEIEQTGSYEGNCTERQTLARWLLSTGGVSNRGIDGEIESEEGILNGEKYPTIRGGGHAWNEFKVTDGKNEFWVPMDWGNVPYLRSDSLYVHYLPTLLPKVISENEESDKLFDCTIKLDQVDELT